MAIIFLMKLTYCNNEDFYCYGVMLTSNISSWENNGINCFLAFFENNRFMKGRRKKCCTIRNIQVFLQNNKIIPGN